MLDRTTPPKVEMLGDFTLPTPKEEILSNGVTLNVLTGGSQDINQLLLVWKGGICEAPSAIVARLASLMLLEGCDGMSSEEVAEALDFRGAIVRAGVGEHFSELSVVCLNSFSKGLLPLIRKMVLSPNYDDKILEVYKEKEAKNLMMSFSKVEALSQMAINPIIMGEGNPMAAVPTIEEIKAVTREDLLAFHSKAYRASGLKAYLSGNITDEIYHSVKETLESLPSLESIELEEHPYVAVAPVTEKVEKADALQSAVKVAFPAPGRDHPDYVPLRFTVMALGGYFGSRLMKNIREDKGYTYGIRSYLLGARDGCYVLISAQCDNRYVEPLLQEVVNELEKLATCPVEGEEMQRLRQYIASALMETLDSPFSISDYYKTEYVVNIPAGYFERQVTIARTLSAEMIMDMARKYLVPSQMRVVVAGK